MTQRVKILELLWKSVIFCENFFQNILSSNKKHSWSNQKLMACSQENIELIDDELEMSFGKCS